MSDTFARASDDYAAARPLYPDALFRWIRETCPGHGAAWDCATGNGQAAIGLARHFDRVEATDISPEQVGEAFPGTNIRYSAQPAERTDFPDSSFDLIAVAQALHWFDHDAFWPEVRRVARPGALFCAWGYAWFRGAAPVEDALLGPVARIVEPYWAPNNRLLWDGYVDVGFPWPRLDPPELRIELSWPLRDIAAYVRTWSAYKRAAEAGHGAALEDAVAGAERTLGAGTRFDLWVPLTILAGFVR
jgi:SAM-dependent methyltransferase